MHHHSRKGREEEVQLDRREPPRRRDRDRERDSGLGDPDLFPKTISIGVPRDETPFPAFGKPIVAGCFSLDSDRKYLEGPKYIKFLQLTREPSLQKVNFDLDKLNYQAHGGVRQELSTSSLASDTEDMHKQTNELVHLLQWIHVQEDVFNQRKPHFVFYRGLMTKILGTPYESREGWKVGAMLKNGTIYLRNIDTPETIQDRHRQVTDPRSRRMTSWGYNFEHFLLSDSPTSQPSPHATNRDKNECNFVFRTKLGSHELLYAAEIDGVWLPPDSSIEINPATMLQPDLLNLVNDPRKCKFVELKTTREWDGEMTRNFRKFNLRKWFCQSYTVGVSHVIAGLRNDEGVVNKLKIFPVKELSDLRMEWSSNVCFKFLELFLNDVKITVGEMEDFVFIFQYDPSASNRFSKCIRVEVQNRSHSDLYLPNIK